MKIHPEHYQHIAASMRRVIAENPNLEPLYQSAGLTPKRCRWDIHYAAKLSTWICDNVYSYANDTHIDTALRRVMRESGLDWAASA